MGFNAGTGLFDKSMCAAYNTLCSDVKVVPVCATGIGQCCHAILAVVCCKILMGIGGGGGGGVCYML